MQQKGKRIVLTGGHAATTALAIVEELVRRDFKGEKWDVFWIGTRVAIEGKKVATLESKILPKVGVKTYPIVAGRLQRKLTFWTIPSLLKIPMGFFHSLFTLLTIKPDIVLSFGGFAAFPVVVTSWILRKPVIIHEQTSAQGRANKYSAPFAKKIALARKESLKYFPKEKCVVVGNPILSQVGEILPKKKMGSPPTVFVTGGSRGSQKINSLLKGILEKLLTEFIVIHQTGSLDYEKFRKVKNSLPANLREKYEVYEMIDPMQIDGVYKRADIVVARAGANTVAEIMAVKRPSVLIPLPISYLDEQTKNAKLAKSFGIAKILKQGGLASKRLFKEINSQSEDWERIVSSVAKKKSPDIKASSKLVDLVEENL